MSSGHYHNSVTVSFLDLYPTHRYNFLNKKTSNFGSFKPEKNSSQTLPIQSNSIDLSESGIFDNCQTIHQLN